MAPSPIRAVIFDMGGTLEEVYYDHALRMQATYGFKEVLARHGIDPGLDVPELYAVVKTGMEKYNKYREATNLELAPERVWGDFVFTGGMVDGERIAAAGEDLSLFYDLQFYRRVVRPEAVGALGALRDRGLRLGVISNIYSRGAVPSNLRRYGLDGYFDLVLASSEVGIRKPDPRIFLEASRRLGFAPSECAYVGDTISRDVVGAHRAGYGLAIQIKSFLTDIADKEAQAEQPDVVVENLMQVVDYVTSTSLNLTGRFSS